MGIMDCSVISQIWAEIKADEYCESLIMCNGKLQGTGHEIVAQSLCKLTFKNVVFGWLCVMGDNS